MKEYIVKEWYDDIGILQQQRVCELVRCGDCIHTCGERPRVVGLVYCKKHKMVKSEQDYCSSGETIK
ncbi:MAG: hypothetical protein IKF29_16935 [Oceanobacillus sp.]|nr:hypothetical protein [Oceanobacillus sp.]